jgi:hypothetical protein
MNRRDIFKSLLGVGAVAVVHKLGEKERPNLAPIKQEGMPVYEPSEGL